MPRRLTDWSDTIIAATIAAIALIIAAVIQLWGQMLQSRSAEVASPQTKAAMVPHTPPEERREAARVGAWLVSDTAITDENGAQAVASVYILSNEYAWQCGSWDAIAIGGSAGDMTPHLLSASMQERFRVQDALVAVGASSHEGEDLQLEEQRAARRSRRLALWIRDSVRGELPPLYTLNLGRHTAYDATAAKCSSASELERPVVIVGVVTRGTTLSVAEALAKAFGQKEFPLSLRSYSQFIVRRHS